MTASDRPTADPLGALLAQYRPPEAVPDELIDPSGELRPAWRPFVEAVAAMTPSELTARQARGDQYLADAGVYYRKYSDDGPAERAWPLSHMPVLIAEGEWDDIVAGLSQRADLLEAVCADLYGDNRLVRGGHIPATLIAHNPEWLRPLVRVTPRGGHFLHFVAFDIGRGPNGAWWVLSDRTQAPSGAGFALENRIATARVYQEHFGATNVHRLAGFFRRFRDSLNALRRGDNRVGVYTPGPMNDTYYEHAYIARYLGFQLLEGDDLTVRDGHLLVRTVAGPMPVSVLWRRVDAEWADPLELTETSTLGTPGLLGAIRQGSVSMVNALGSGVLETRAFLAFLPRIAPVLLGKELAMPNIATWWCGQDAERAYVTQNAEAMTIGDAFGTRLLFETDEVLRRVDRPAEPAELAKWIAQNAESLVGQEAVTLSTTPAFGNGGLTPRPMTIRVFLARTAEGWVAMPGGFARVGHSASTKLAMQQGGSAADVWIVSDASVRDETMLAASSAPFTREVPGQLPSRAADSLFWLGRYVERAEHTLRLSRAYHLRLADAASEATQLLDLVRGTLRLAGSDPADGLPKGAAEALASAENAAAAIRDRFSVDGWNALTDLSRTVPRLQRSAPPGDEMARALGLLLRKLSSFSGLVHENMYRLTGWRFLSIGRALERALALCTLLQTFADPDAPEGALDLAVEVGDAAMTLRRRYAVATNRATVVDLLALDPLNPRAVIYQLNAIAEHVEALPGSEAFRQMTPLQRAVLKAQRDTALMTPDSLTTDALADLHDAIAVLSDQLVAAYLA